MDMLRIQNVIIVPPTVLFFIIAKFADLLQTVVSLAFATSTHIKLAFDESKRIRCLIIQLKLRSHDPIDRLSLCWRHLLIIIYIKYDAENRDEPKLNLCCEAQIRY